MYRGGCGNGEHQSGKSARFEEKNSASQMKESAPDAGAQPAVKTDS